MFGCRVMLRRIMSDEDREVTELLSQPKRMGRQKSRRPLTDWSLKGAEKLWNQDGRKSGFIRDRLVPSLQLWGSLLSGVSKGRRLTA